MRMLPYPGNMQAVNVHGKETNEFPALLIKVLEVAPREGHLAEGKTSVRVESLITQTPIDARFCGEISCRRKVEVALPSRDARDGGRGRRLSTLTTFEKRRVSQATSGASTEERRSKGDQMSEMPPYPTTSTRSEHLNHPKPRLSNSVERMRSTYSWMCFGALT